MASAVERKQRVLNTYKGILRGGRIELGDEAPSYLKPDHPAAVHVTILDEAPDAVAPPAQGQRMAAAPEQIAALGGIAAIDDPVAWEHEMRQDRPLADRVD